MLSKIKETTDFLIKKGFSNPEYGIILGTGLGKLVNEISIETEINYSGIPNFPISTVEFHSGKLIFGTINNKKVIALQGRFHIYEGYTAQEVSFPVRVLKLLGVQKLIISNAAGAINLDFKKGDLMLISDHINLLPSPLIGKNIAELGPRFPDMSDAYNSDLRTKMTNIAAKININIQHGVYSSIHGPMLETASEYRFLRNIGADAVGMSTTPEVIVANHMNLPCVAISVLTDECDPDNLKPVNIEEIIEVAGKAELKLIKLIKEFID